MKRLVFAVFLVTVVLSGCSDSGHGTADSTAAALAKLVAEGNDHVTARELADWLIKDRRDFELVDIRETADFDAGHIERARHIPLAGLFSEASLASLPAARRIVVYSNGSAHAAQAALLLRLTGRDALALLGGFNYWQAYLHDPEKAGVAEMDPAERARYEATACYFTGGYIADTGLPPGGSTAAGSSGEQAADGAAEALGLGLGLGTDQVQSMQQPETAPGAEPSPADALGLGLGLGNEAVRSIGEPEKPQSGTTQRLLIRGEC